jgi:hypothetical protein
MSLARCDGADLRFAKGEITVKELVLSSVLVLSLLANPLTLPGRTPPQGAAGKWETVKQVPIGRELIVKLKDGKTVKARHAGATETAVTVSRKNRLLEIERSSIHRVSIIVKGNKEKAQAIGAGVGAVSLSLTAIGDTDDIHPALYVISVALIGAGIGYLIGSLVGLRSKTVLIYESSG